MEQQTTQFDYYWDYPMAKVAKSRIEAPSILNYQDYREFLREVYSEQKKRLPRYSYRKFSEDLGFKASNYLHLVLKGERNLSLDAVGRIKNSFHWSAQEKKYFHHLVLLNQASTPKEREKNQTQLDKLLTGKRKLLDADEHLYFSNWFIPVIREIISLKQFVKNLNWIAKKLQPKVTESQVKEAIQTLERLGMVEKDKGKWKQSTEHLTTEIELTSELVHNYHNEMLNLSQKALDHKAKDRDISAVTK